MDPLNPLITNQPNVNNNVDPISTYEQTGTIPTTQNNNQNMIYNNNNNVNNTNGARPVFS